MGTTGLEAFDTTVHKTQVWLNDLMAELGWDDRHRAYLALRTVLHALRDHLTVETTAHLAAQLPLLVRGIYFEGWKPSGKPVRERHKEEFVGRVLQAFRGDSRVQSEAVVGAVFKVLSKHIEPGAVEHVLHVLPAEIRALWPRPPVRPASGAATAPQGDR